MKKLKNGLYKIEPSLKEAFLSLWNIYETPDSIGTILAEHEAYKDVKYAMEKLRSGQNLSWKELEILHSWRLRAGTIYGYDYKVWQKFINQFIKFCEKEGEVR